MQKAIGNGEFLEFAEYANNLYGTRCVLNVNSDGMWWEIWMGNISIIYIYTHATGTSCENTMYFTLNAVGITGSSMTWNLYRFLQITLF